MTASESETRSNDAHLDTSIQMERCKHRHLSAPVEVALRQYSSRGTSSYAKLEFYRAWIQRLAYLHELCIQFPDLPRVMAHISTLPPILGRTMATTFQALSAHLDQQSSSLPSDIAFIRLRSHIGEAIMGWDQWWRTSINSECSGTACARANLRPRQKSSGSIHVVIPKCRPDKRECHVDTFFSSRMSEFKSLAAATDSRADSSGQSKRAALRVQSACHDPASLADNKECAKISDWIIALDSATKSTLVANNDSDWLAIAATLRRELHNPVREAKTNAIQAPTLEIKTQPRVAISPTNPS